MGHCTEEDTGVVGKGEDIGGDMVGGHPDSMAA